MIAPLKRSIGIVALVALFVVISACGGGEDTATQEESPTASPLAGAAAGAPPTPETPPPAAEPAPEPSSEPEPEPEPAAEPEPTGLTKSEYIIQADVICAELTVRTEALGEPETFEEIATWAAAFTEIAEDGLPRLQALEPPADDRQDADATMALLAEQAALVPELGAAAQAGDEDGIGALIDRLTEIGTEIDPPARAYGFRDCGVDDTSQETGGAVPGQDQGDMKLSYVRSEDEALQATIGVIADSMVLDTIVNGVNETLALPSDIEVFVAGEIPGPLYDRQNNRILMPAEFADLAFTLFNNSGLTETPQEALDLTLATLAFVFLHEVGHALTTQLELPITGREEDAADQLATVIVTSAGDQAGAIAIAAATLFGLFSTDREQFQVADFWDEHSLNEQRFFNILCWVFGSDPAAYGEAVVGSGIGENRLVRCEGEWEQLSGSWETLLAPHLKP